MGNVGTYQAPHKPDHSRGYQPPLEAAVSGPSNVAIGMFFALRLDQVLFEDAVDVIGFVRLTLFKHRKQLRQL